MVNAFIESKNFNCLNQVKFYWKRKQTTGIKTGSFKNEIVKPFSDFFLYASNRALP